MSDTRFERAPEGGIGYEVGSPLDENLYETTVPGLDNVLEGDGVDTGPILQGELHD